MQLNRWGGVLVALMVLSGCTSQADPSVDPSGPVATASSTASPTSLDDIAMPTDSVALQPSTLVGEQVSLGDGVTITIPDGSTSVEPTPPKDGASSLSYRMPEPDDNGLPTVTVTWLATSEPIAYTDSFVHETTMSSSASESISDYRRAKVDWPGAKAAVLSTWTESVPLQDGSELTVDAELFFVDSDGAAFQIFVIAPSGELAGSTADEVLRSLDLG